MGWTDGSVPDDGGMPTDDGAPPTDAGPPSPWVDPGCIDGMYGESLGDGTADISSLLAGYSSADFQTFVDGVLSMRYPIGAHIVRQARTHTEVGGDCVDLFLSDRSTGEAVIRGLSTVVHECGHFLDLGESGFSSAVYVITDALTLTCSGGDATGRGGMTFARSRIRGDSYQTLRPACPGGSPSPGCDSYADVYLDGNPDDATFDGGDQGFDSLLEETAQYVNSLATSHAFTREIGAGGRRVSERDGILTFLWYLERYLRLARESYPAAHSFLLADSCWRTAILTLWGRAWLFLEATVGMAHLGIDDDAILGLVTDPTLLAEIELVRVAAGCP